MSDVLREALEDANKELLNDEMSDLGSDHLYSRRMAFIRSVRAALAVSPSPAPLDVQKLERVLLNFGYDVPGTRAAAIAAAYDAERQGESA